MVGFITQHFLDLLKETHQKRVFFLDSPSSGFPIEKIRTRPLSKSRYMVVSIHIPSIYHEKSHRYLRIDDLSH